MAIVDRIQTVGAYFVAKWNQRAREKGTEHAARMMRKQGIPLDVALVVLVGRV